MASQVFTQGGSNWASKITDLCAKALGNRSAATQKEQNASFYPNHQHMMEMVDGSQEQVEFRLHENETKREIQELRLSACEDSLNLHHDARVLGIAAETELHRLSTAHPSRSTWQGLDPKKHSNYLPQRPSVTAAPSYYPAETQRAR
jgi:hypothetical protein